MLQIICCISTSFYDCELRNLNNIEVQNLCATWQKSVHRVWDLALVSSSALVYIVANSIPNYDEMDEIYHGSSNFIPKAAARKCDLINFVVRNGLYYYHTQSPLRRNAVTCCLGCGIPIAILRSVTLGKVY